MNREITVTITPELKKSLSLSGIRITLIIASFLTWVYLTPYIVACYREGSLTWKTCAGVFFVGLIITLIFCALPLYLIQKRTNVIKKTTSSVIKYRITDDGIQVQSPLEFAQYSWNDLKNYWKGPKVWTAWTRSGAFIVLPIELLDEDLKTFLVPRFSKGSKLNQFENSPLSFMLFWILFLIFTIGLGMFCDHR
jgi:Na+/melibiose symporter-like transporter